jgi:hypothetical protein
MITIQDVSKRLELAYIELHTAHTTAKGLTGGGQQALLEDISDLMGQVHSTLTLLDKSGYGVLESKP